MNKFNVNTFYPSISFMEFTGEEEAIMRKDSQSGEWVHINDYAKLYYELEELKKKYCQNEH